MRASSSGVLLRYKLRIKCVLGTAVSGSHQLFRGGPGPAHSSRATPDGAQQPEGPPSGTIQPRRPRTALLQGDNALLSLPEGTGQSLARKDGSRLLAAGDHGTPGKARARTRWGQARPVQGSQGGFRGTS